MKKIICMLLCVIMLSSFTIVAYADTSDSLIRVLEYETLEDGTIKITKFDSADSTFEMPSEIDGKKVTVIGKKAFKECHMLRTVIVADTVTTIENNAFERCDRLKTVILGSGVQSLGYKSFAECEVLESIYLPQSLKTIGNNCFIRCFALDNVIIPKSVTSIGNYAFSDCTGMTNVTFEDGEFTIGEYAFSWCLKLSDVKLGANVKEIKNYAFYACEKLTDFAIESKDCVIFDSADTLPANAKVTAYENSTAHTYAVKYNRSFLAIEEPFEVMLGDVDLDNRVTILDATVVQLFLSSRRDLSQNAIKNADTNRDTKITIIDATFIQMYMAQLIEEF